jgi:hypothetical protein
MGARWACPQELMIGDAYFTGYGRALANSRLPAQASRDYQDASECRSAIETSWPPGKVRDLLDGDAEPDGGHEDAGDLCDVDRGAGSGAQDAAREERHDEVDSSAVEDVQAAEDAHLHGRWPAGAGGELW